MTAVRTGCLVAVWLLGGVISAAADPAPAARVLDGERVFVSGVPDTFPKVREAIERARSTSGRDYRVVVVDDASSSGGARALLEQIIAAWSASASGTAPGFDPSADVTVLVDLGNREITVDVPSSLEVNSGLDIATAKEELIDGVFMPKARDGRYDEGLAELIDAAEAWVVKVRNDAVARDRASRIFRTRTLPLAAAGVLGGGAALGLLLQVLRHRRAVGEARKRLSEFKRDVVALSDLLDEQQERHRMLPHSDPDFVTPMQGLTRSTYDGVQSALGRYRERWLGLMEVWERAQTTLDGERWLGTAAARQAIGLLDSAEAQPPLDEVAAECRAPLDALEQAHEKARSLAEGLGRALEETRRDVAALATRGRSDAAFREPLATVARGLELARLDVERDPVAARGRLEEAEGVRAAVVQRMEDVTAADDRRLAVLESVAKTAAATRQRRGEGWLLAEPGADPDVPLAEATASCQTAAQLLDTGETAAAIDQIVRAERAHGDAAALLENIAAAKARIEEELPGVAARLDALLGRRGTAAATLQRLAAEYAQRSWADVGDNVVKADEGIGRARSLVAGVAEAADTQRQHYFRGVALLDECLRQEDWADACLAAIVDRAQELDELRASLPARCGDLRSRVAALAERLRRQQTDRVRANERCREAARLQELAAAGIDVARPDLPEVRQLVVAGEEAVVRAAELADEDERLSRQAAHELEETDALLRRVAAWYAEGVKADVQGAATLLEHARSLLARQRYEEALKACGGAAQEARAAYATATAEANRRAQQRQMEIRRRQMEESFSRTSRGSGPLWIDLPGGTFSGPDPWRTAHRQAGGGSSGRTASGTWSRSIAGGSW